MPSTKSWVGEADPNFDQDFADGFLGKYVLVGITHLTPDGGIERQEQLHGLIQAVSPTGIDIALAGSCEGEVWRMPPMLEELVVAEPGIYALRTTGETVENPDFTLRISIRSGRKN